MWQTLLGNFLAGALHGQERCTARGSTNRKFPTTSGKYQNRQNHSCTRVRGPPVTTRAALHVSQQISSESWGFSGVAAVSRYTPYTPLKGPLAPVALRLPEVSHVRLPLKRCRATVGCSSYTCGCRATLCNYGQNQHALKGSFAEGVALST